MSLDKSTVHRNLDSKFKFFGMELFDVIGIGAVTSTMNLIFGQTNMVELMVFGFPALLTLIVYFGKKGKPDRFLQDSIRFSILPGVFCVGEPLTKEIERRSYIVT